jgi:hypothetical protein
MLLVIGAGQSTVGAVRAGDNDPENWTIARVLFPEHLERLAAREDRWCVLVEADESDLDRDSSVVAYRTIHDWHFALGACEGVPEREREAARMAMFAAGAVG